MGESILGPLERREKTDIRVPKDLADRVTDLAHDLGIPRNAVYVMGACLLVDKLGSFTDKRTQKSIAATVAALLEEVKARA